MKKNFYLILLVLFTFVIMFSQKNTYSKDNNDETSEKKDKIIFSKIYYTLNNEKIIDIQSLKNGDYIAVGYRKTLKKSDILIIRFNKSGNIIWKKSFGKGGWDKANSVLITEDDHIIVAGETLPKNTIGRMAKVIKLDDTGKMVWQKYLNFGDDNELNSIIETADNNYIFTGSIFFQKKKKSYMWILKLNKKGHIKINKTYGGDTWSAGNSIKPSKDNGYIIAGVKETPENKLKDIWIIKLNNKAEILWEKQSGNCYYDSANSIIQTENSNYLVAGYSYNENTVKSSGWILNLDKEGDLIWDKIYGGKNWDTIYKIIKTYDDNFILIGYTKSQGKNGKDAWIIKIDNTGKILWEKTYGDINDDEALCITQSSQDNGYIIAGYSTSHESEFKNVWLLKTDTNGYAYSVSAKKDHNFDIIKPIIYTNNLTYSLEWDKVYNTKMDEEYLYITKYNDDDFIIGGYKELGKKRKKQGTISTISSEGFIKWKKFLGGEGDEQINYIYPLSKKSYIAVGYTKSKGKGKKDLWLIKANKKGRIIWNKTFGGKNNDKGHSIIPANDKGFIIAGTTLSKGNGGNDIWIVKINRKGKKIWDKTYGGIADDEIFSMIPCKTGGYIIGGHTYSKGKGQSDIWIFKIDPKGHIIWEKTYGDEYHDGIYSLKHTKNGGLICAGYSYNKNGGSDYKILHLSISGKLLWEKTYTRSLEDTAYSVDQTYDDSFIVAGTTFSKGIGAWDIWILKLDNTGSILWSKSYGGSGVESIKNIKETGTNTYILIGSTTSKKNDYKRPLVVKFKEIPGYNKILIRTNPKEANVYLNGKLKGLSPIAVSAKKPGVYNLKIEKADHFITKDKITINNTALDKLYYNLKSKTGTLMVISSYSNMIVTIDDNEKNIISQNKIYQTQLRQGKHELKFKTDDFLKAKKTIYVINKSTNIIILNDKFFKSYGYTATNTNSTNINE